MTLQLRHLQAFVAVAEEGTFTAASKRLNLSQPPLSRHVQHLERELGSLLFVRSHDGAALTAEGRAFLDRALTVLRSFRDIEEFTASRPATRVMQIGIDCGLWDALDRIRALHATRMTGERLNGHDLCGTRRSRSERPADLLLTRSRLDPADWECALVFEEQIVALIRDGHRLASRTSVTLSELASEPLLMVDEDADPGLYHAAQDLIRRARITPRVLHGQPPPCTVRAKLMIASGEGFYLGTSGPFTQSHRASGVIAVPLCEPDAKLPVHLAWRTGASDTVREFARAARDAFALQRVARSPRQGVP